MTVESTFQSLINGSDETQECESLLLSHGHWITDGLPRFHHVAREEETYEMSFV